MLGGSLVIRPPEKKGGLARIPISCQARWVQTKSPLRGGQRYPGSTPWVPKEALNWFRQGQSKLVGQHMNDAPKVSGWVGGNEEIYRLTESKNVCPQEKMSW